MCQQTNSQITESSLILARVGLYHVYIDSTNFTHAKVCQLHLDTFGLYWKCHSSKCKHPLHGESKRKADRGISYAKAVEIYLYWKYTVLVGVGKIIMNEATF